MEGFTIHGLSKVFVGKLWERVYWGAVLAAALGFLFFKMHGFHTQFKRNDYRTEIRNIDVHNHVWPEVRVCYKDGDRFCYNNYTVPNHNAGTMIPCQTSASLSIGNVWAKKINFTRDYFSPACVRLKINEAFDFDPKLKYYGLLVLLKGVKAENLSLTRHQFRLSIGDPMVYHDAKFGDITVDITDVTKVNRLQFPFQSNCTYDGAGMNIFPGPYTREKCVYTFQFQKMLKHCGDVPNHWKKYVKPYHKRGWDWQKRNRTDLNVRTCIYWYNSYRESLLPSCPLPCHEMTSKFELKQGQWNHGQSFTIARFHIDSRVTEVTELPTYTSDNFFSDVGSWLGLLVGMSCLSLVEVVTFVFTAVREQCSNLRQAVVRSR